jgi:excisionase family DNA binding protein
MDSDVTTSVAARTLNVHPDTLKRWAIKGKVPFWKTPGGHMRFKQSDIEALHTAQLADAEPKQQDSAA